MLTRNPVKWESRGKNDIVVNLYRLELRRNCEFVATLLIRVYILGNEIYEKRNGCCITIIVMLRNSQTYSKEIREIGWTPHKFTFNNVIFISLARTY